LTWFLTNQAITQTTNTFLLAANGIPFTATNTSHLALFNGPGSGKVLRIYRVWVVNSAQDTGLTGAQQLLGLNRITAVTASNWRIEPVSYDSTAPNIPVQILAGSKFTVTTTDLFKRVAWSSDEVNSQTSTIDEHQLVPGFTYLWDVGYNDANVEPIVCREGFGVSVQNIGYTAVAPANAGYLDVFIEFTMI
jgi:hypothetical protein